MLTRIPMGGSYTLLDNVKFVAFGGVLFASWIACTLPFLFVLMFLGLGEITFLIAPAIGTYLFLKGLRCIDKRFPSLKLTSD